MNTPTNSSSSRPSTPATSQKSPATINLTSPSINLTSPRNSIQNVSSPSIQNQTTTASSVNKQQQQQQQQIQLDTQSPAPSPSVVKVASKDWNNELSNGVDFNFWFSSFDDGNNSNNNNSTSSTSNTNTSNNNNMNTNMNMNIHNNDNHNNTTQTLKTTADNTATPTSNSTRTSTSTSTATNNNSNPDDQYDDEISQFFNSDPSLAQDFLDVENDTSTTSTNNTNSGATSGNIPPTPTTNSNNNNNNSNNNNNNSNIRLDVQQPSPMLSSVLAQGNANTPTGSFLSNSSRSSFSTKPSSSPFEVSMKESSASASTSSSQLINSYGETNINTLQQDIEKFSKSLGNSAQQVAAFNKQISNPSKSTVTTIPPGYLCPDPYKPISISSSRLVVSYKPTSPPPPSSLKNVNELNIQFMNHQHPPHHSSHAVNHTNSHVQQVNHSSSNHHLFNSSSLPYGSMINNSNTSNNKSLSQPSTGSNTPNNLSSSPSSSESEISNEQHKNQRKKGKSKQKKLKQGNKNHYMISSSSSTSMTSSSSSGSSENMKLMNPFMLKKIQFTCHSQSKRKYLDSVDLCVLLSDVSQKPQTMRTFIQSNHHQQQQQQQAKRITTTTTTTTPFVYNLPRFYFPTSNENQQQQPQQHHRGFNNHPNRNSMMSCFFDLFIQLALTPGDVFYPGDLSFGIFPTIQTLQCNYERFHFGSLYELLSDQTMETTETFSSYSMQNSLDPLFSSTNRDRLRQKLLFSFEQILSKSFGKNHVKGPLTCDQWFQLHDQEQQQTDEMETSDDENSNDVHPASRFVEYFPTPMLLVGNKSSWLEVKPTQFLTFWEKTSLKPFFAKKNFSYFVLCPKFISQFEKSKESASSSSSSSSNHESKIVSRVLGFFKELGSLYETCNLGNLQPISNSKYSNGLVWIPMENDETFIHKKNHLRTNQHHPLHPSDDLDDDDDEDDEGDDDDDQMMIDNDEIPHHHSETQQKNQNQMPSTSSSSSSSCSMVERQLHAFKEACDRLSKDIENHTMYSDNCLLIFIINPFTYCTSVLELCNCLASIKKVLLYNGQNVSFQFIQYEHIFRSPPCGQNSFLKEVAVSAFNKCRRISYFGGDSSTPATLPSYSNSPSCIYTLYEPLFILSRPSRTQNNLHCAYRRSLDQKWLSIIFTDSHGELLEQRSIPLFPFSTEENSNSKQQQQHQIFIDVDCMDDDHSTQQETNNDLPSSTMIPCSQDPSLVFKACYQLLLHFPSPVYFENLTIGKFGRFSSDELEGLCFFFLFFPSPSQFYLPKIHSMIQIEWKNILNDSTNHQIPKVNKIQIISLIITRDMQLHRFRQGL